MRRGLDGTSTCELSLSTQKGLWMDRLVWLYYCNEVAASLLCVEVVVTCCILSHHASLVDIVFC
jgi:hypothetical protein